MPNKIDAVSQEAIIIERLEGNSSKVAIRRLIKKYQEFVSMTYLIEYKKRIELH